MSYISGDNVKRNYAVHCVYACKKRCVYACSPPPRSSVFLDDKNVLSGAVVSLLLKNDCSGVCVCVQCTAMVRC